MTLSTDFHAQQDALKRMKPTIVNGQWVLAPAPPQDEAWLRKEQLTQKERRT